MAFEELQDLWQQQEDDKMFTVDETALHNTIRHKSRNVGRWLGFFEWFMIGVNLLVGLALVVDGTQEGGPTFQYVAAAVYVVYGVVAFVRRLTRRQEEVQFEPTLLGDLNRAIWQIEYHIRQTRTITFWYLLPLVLLAVGPLLFRSGALWPWFFLPALLLFSYFGTRWEINRWFLPKKEALEALRQQLLEERDRPPT